MFVTDTWGEEMDSIAISVLHSCIPMLRWRAIKIKQKYCMRKDQNTMQEIANWSSLSVDRQIKYDIT